MGIVYFYTAHGGSEGVIMRSDSYVMTVDTHCAGSMLELENLRTAISNINKLNKRLENGYFYRGKLPRYRVKCQGRGPRATAAMSDGKHPRSYDQSLPLKHAKTMDVYVYQRV